MSEDLASTRMEARDAIVVFVTAANVEEATRMAERLVEAHLAACVQVLPQINSIYRWKGAIEHQNEVLLLIKTVQSSFQGLEREVRELHSYETPEIIALPVTTSSTPYLEWLIASVDPRS